MSKIETLEAGMDALQRAEELTKGIRALFEERPTPAVFGAFIVSMLVMAPGLSRRQGDVLTTVRRFRVRTEDIEPIKQISHFLVEREPCPLYVLMIAMLGEFVSVADELTDDELTLLGTFSGEVLYKGTAPCHCDECEALRKQRN